MLAGPGRTHESRYATVQPLAPPTAPKLCSAAVSAAVVRASRPHWREQDALATTGKMPALRKTRRKGEPAWPSAAAGKT